MASGRLKYSDNLGFITGRPRWFFVAMGESVENPTRQSLRPPGSECLTMRLCAPNPQ